MIPNIFDVAKYLYLQGCESITANQGEKFITYVTPNNLAGSLLFSDLVILETVDEEQIGEYKNFDELKEAWR